ncbi:hypothetical protein P3342_007296 [Pyrenophora teres f. teres]|nr:hypothetical protein P3342_007296 [Pyrenophora teres f. teres]
MASGEFTQDNGANSQNPGTQPSYEDLLAANESLRAGNDQLRQGLNQVTAELQQAQGIYPELPTSKLLAAHKRGSSAGPTHNPPAADLDVRKFEKPRLPDVKVFDKGSHEEYTQWKIQIRTKLSADRLAYPTEFYQVHYVISRTEGWAFSALRSYITTINNGEKEPKLNELWSQLDGFFEDPAVKQKALQYLRTTKQGKGEPGEKNDSLKIDYLQNSLNKKLLRYQAGYQPPLNETYDNFVQRMRVTWENLKAIDQLSSNAPIYSTKLSSTNPTTSDEMDWPKLPSEERKCKATVPKRQRKPENTAKVLAANVEDESSDEGKKSPSPKAPTRAVQADIVRELNLPRVPIPPRRINGVDNQKSTVQVITHFTIDAGGVRKEVAAYIILSTYEYDMILGKTWLE